jgi:cytochrome b subunit of formate dehydrogenase
MEAMMSNFTESISEVLIPIPALSLLLLILVTGVVMWRRFR